jgi:methyl-accepting chemotaxis protein
MLPLIVTMVYMHREVGRIDQKLDFVVEQRLPTATHLASIAFELADSVAAMRGYMLTGLESFKTDRAEAWKDLEESRRLYDAEAQNFTNPRNREAWLELNALITRLKDIQDKLEAAIPVGTRATDAHVAVLRDELGPVARRAIQIIEGDGKGDEGQSARQTKILTDDVNMAKHWIEQMEIAMMVSGAVSLLISLLALYFVQRMIARPMVQMTAAMQAVAGKNYAVDIPAEGQKDELGGMANALATFRDGLSANDRLEAEAAKARELEAARQAKVSEAIAAFQKSSEQVVLTISSASTELEAAANDLSHSAQEATMEASSVAAASQQASANINGLAAAGEELNATASEISRLLTASSESTGTAVLRMRATDEEVQALAAAADKIGSVVVLINGLASQTNLLALNATIEAARAGEAGRGFAVVASEVKGLAAQTARATTEIGTIVEEIRHVTDRTVSAIGDIDSAIKAIEHATTEIAGTVAQQEKATREISVNVQQAASGAEDVSRAITHVSSAASNTAAASSQVLGSAADLSKQAEIMRREVSTFLDAVRAA